MAESCAERLRELYPARLGTVLIRLRARDKRPIDSGWNVQAAENYTNQIDPGPIIDSIAAHVDAGGNVGWAVPPGLLVLDADNEASAAWLCQALPDAPRQRTAKGCHVVVREPRGVDLRQVTQFEIVDGITVDLRTSGSGQIAVEPSIHPSGFAYHWELELPIDLDAIPDVPAAVLERMKSNEATKGGPVDISEATWREGSRETRLVSMAGRLRNMSLSEAEIRDTLAALNRERCSPPLSDRDVARIARSAGKWDRGKDPTEEYARIHQDGYVIEHIGDVSASFANDYQIKGLLNRGAMSVIYGQSGSSKTFCALELGIAVASGQPWRGQRTRKGRVVYVAAEGARGIKNRISALRDRVALGDLETVEFYLLPSVVRLDRAGPDIDLFVQTVQRTIASTVDLVIIDTLSRSIAGKDENSAADMTTAVEAADMIRDALDCGVLIVHHSGKNEALGARGHSSLRAALETEIEVKRVGDAYSLAATKQRDIEDDGVWWHELETVVLGTDEDGDPVTTCVVRPLDEPPGDETVGNVRLNANEQRTHEALLALVGGSADLAIENREAVPKADLRQWVEQNCGIPTNLRRGVVRKGLEGLKNKGLVGVEGESVFLMKKVEDL